MEKKSKSKVPLHIQKNWKNFFQELDDENDESTKDFVLILIKICDQKEQPFKPLEMVLDLAEGTNYPDLNCHFMKFILEHAHWEV